MLADFPAHIQQKVQRILDTEARRLLAEQVDMKDHAGSIAATAQSKKERDE